MLASEAYFRGKNLNIFSSLHFCYIDSNDSSSIICLRIDRGEFDIRKKNKRGLINKLRKLFSHKPDKLLYLLSPSLYLVSGN